jgi:site-specific recombinase XerC
MDNGKWAMANGHLPFTNCHCPLMKAGQDIRTVQELLGHNDVRTTMIYTHVMQTAASRVRSPLDALG